MQSLFKSKDIGYSATMYEVNIKGCVDYVASKAFVPLSYTSNPKSVTMKYRYNHYISAYSEPGSANDKWHYGVVSIPNVPLD